jgi:hypothetical protein
LKASLIIVSIIVIPWNIIKKSKKQHKKIKRWDQGKNNSRRKIIIQKDEINYNSHSGGTHGRTGRSTAEKTMQRSREAGEIPNNNKKKNQTIISQKKPKPKSQKQRQPKQPISQ